MFQRLAVLLGLTCLAWVSSAQSQSAFEPQHQEALAANPADVRLKIAIDPSLSTFHIGETIRVKYESTADARANTLLLRGTSIAVSDPGWSPFSRTAQPMRATRCGNFGIFTALFPARTFLRRVIQC